MTSPDHPAGGALAEVLALGVVPIVVVDDATDAERLGRALIDGGLPCVEVTLRTAAALEVIARLARLPGLHVGAGTVTTPELAEQAVAAGASFVVAPGLSARTVERCRELGVPHVPGVVTPSEIMAALDVGLDVLKFFPAAASGGTAALAALGGPFPAVRFMATGGITAESMADYLSLANVVAVGGSWIAPAELQRAGRWGEISERARQAVTTAQAVTRR